MIWRISWAPRPSGRFLSTAMRRRIVSFSSLSNAALDLDRALGVGLLVGVAGAGLERSPPRPAVVASWRSSLSSAWRRGRRARPSVPLDLAQQALVDARGASNSRLALPACSASSRCAAASFLISPCAMSRASRISRSVTPVAPASTIRMASSVPATIRSRSSLFSRTSSSRGLTTKLPSILPMRTAPTGAANGMSETISAARGAVHREDVVGVHVVDRQRDRHQLRLEAPALGEQRADRAVDHARGQRALLAGAALALEERAGDLARGVHALLDVDGQGEEVDVARLPAVAVQRTMVSPLRTTTAPPACFASFRSRTRSSCRRSPPRRGLRQTCSCEFFTSGHPVGGPFVFRTLVLV